MIIAGTGHRPNKLGGYDIYAHKKLIDFAKERLIEYQPSTIISGMALGWDTAIAEAAVDLDIPFHAYIPFRGQELRWPIATRATYNALLKKAQFVRVCSDGDYSPRAMQIRNQCMVDACDLLLALWNGTPGGTANCVAYAVHQQKPCHNLWYDFSKEPQDWLTECVKDLP